MLDNDRHTRWCAPAGVDLEGKVGAADEDRGPAVPIVSSPRVGMAATTLRHAAAVVASDEEMLAAALPYLDEGLRSGDLVVLSCRRGTAALIRAGLGLRGAAVAEEVGFGLLEHRAPDAIGTIGAYLRRSAGSGTGRLRLLVEVDVDREPSAGREQQRFDAAVNRLFAGAPLTMACLYDRRRLPAELVDSVVATHPFLLAGRGWSPSPGFQDPGDYVRALRVHREPMEAGEPFSVIDRTASLVAMRHRLAAVLAGCVPDPDQRDDLHLAVSEIVANAFRHGVAPVSARLWAAPDRLVCVIADRGHGYDDPFAGFVPAHGPDLSRGGMGLWLARKLWDHVDLLPGAAGLEVRLSTRLHQPVPNAGEGIGRRLDGNDPSLLR